MAKIEKVLEEAIWLGGNDAMVAANNILAHVAKHPGYDRLKLRDPGGVDCYTSVQLIGIRDETPAEAAQREADAVAAERRELDAAKAKVAEIEARLAGKE